MKRIFFIFCLITSFSTVGQTPDQWETMGDEAFSEYDFVGAAFYYGNALTLDSLSGSLHHKKAEAHRFYNAYGKAAFHYDWVCNNADESLFPNDCFWLAKMLKSSEQYQESSSWFISFQSDLPENSDISFKVASDELKSIKWAIQFQDSVSAGEVIHLNQVNTYDAEFGLNWLNDTAFTFNQLHFDSANTWSSKSDESMKSLLFSAILIDQKGNDVKSKLDSNFYFDTAFALNPFITDSLLFYTRFTPSVCHILYKIKTDTGWSKSINPGIAINRENSSSTHPTLFTDKNENWLIFSSNKEGNYNIYKSRFSDGKFNKAEPINEINSPGNEVTPFVEGNTLYFSSDYWEGYGGYDVFKTVFDSSHHIINLKKPINSPQNELYFRKNESQDKAIFVSNRIGSLAKVDKTCCNDIYLYNQDSNQILQEETDTLFVSVNNDTAFIPVQTDSLVLPKLKAPNLKLNPIVCYFDNDVPSKSNQENFESLSLKYIRNQQYKKFNAADSISNFHLKNQHAIKRIETLKNFLSKCVAQQVKVELEFSGYTSPLASTQYNIQLAKRRINTMLTSILLKQPELEEAYKKGLIKLKVNVVGEKESALKVSDNRLKTSQSVFSYEAMKARKVTISNVSILEQFPY